MSPSAILTVLANSQRLDTLSLTHIFYIYQHRDENVQRLEFVTMPFFVLRTRHPYEKIFKRTYYTLLISTLLALSIAFPLLAPRIPPPLPPTPRSILLFITLWAIGLTPTLFCLGCLIGGICYYRSWRGSILAKKLAEEESARERYTTQLRNLDAQGSPLWTKMNMCRPLSSISTNCEDLKERLRGPQG
jgi:hypothetical protein